MIKWLMCLALLIACSSKSDDATLTMKRMHLEQAIEKPTKKLVLKELRRLGVKHPRIVLAQSVLETGHYKSAVCRTHNNLFGFRVKSGYLRFKDWKECCAYYKRWQDRHYKPNKHTSYYGFLRSIGYAEDPEYTAKVKIITNELNKQ